MNDNLSAFLAMIRACEGTAGPDGYRTLFGHSLFDSFADHPRKRFEFRQKDGKTNYTTAAGAYQFLASTWDTVAGRLGLTDFSPANQDIAATELIRGRSALSDVLAGRFDLAVRKCGREWASLPEAPYPQPTRSWDFARRAYVTAGGSFQPVPEPPPASSPTRAEDFEAPSPPEPVFAPEPPHAAPMRSGDPFSNEPGAWDQQPAPTVTSSAPDLPATSPAFDVAAPLFQPAQGARMPIPAIAGLVATLLPSILQAVPALTKIIKREDGQSVTERNAQVLERVGGILMGATGVDTIEGAVRRLQADPAAREAAERDAKLAFSELMDMMAADESSRKEARAWFAEATRGQDWKSIGFGAGIFVLALIVIGGGGWILYGVLRDPSTDAQTKGMIIGGIIASVTSVLSFFFGSSASSRSKDAALTSAVQRR